MIIVSTNAWFNKRGSTGSTSCLLILVAKNTPLTSSRENISPRFPLTEKQKKSLDSALTGITFILCFTSPVKCYDFSIQAVFFQGFENTLVVSKVFALLLLECWRITTSLKLAKSQLNTFFSSDSQICLSSADVLASLAACCAASIGGRRTAPRETCFMALSGFFSAFSTDFSTKTR